MFFPAVVVDVHFVCIRLLTWQTSPRIVDVHFVCIKIHLNHLLNWTKMARKKPVDKDASSSDASSSDIEPQLDQPAAVVVTGASTKNVESTEASAQKQSNATRSSTASKPIEPTPWRSEKWKLASHVARVGRQHTGVMQLRALTVLKQCVENDPKEHPERVKVPKWAFGQWMERDKRWFQLVFQYARLPLDLEWTLPVGNRAEVEVMPDPIAFFQTVRLVAGAQEKRSMAVTIALRDEYHSPPMMHQALNALADCMAMEPPSRPGKVHFPFWAFGQECEDGHHWLSQVFRYACIPDDVEWARTNDRDETESTASNREEVTEQEGVEDSKPAASLGSEEADGTEEGEVEDSKPAASQPTTETLGYDDDVVSMPSVAYIAMLEENSRNKSLAEAACNGVVALEEAYSYRDPNDLTRSRIPVWAFGMPIQADTQWWHLVYSHGRVPADISFVWTDTLRAKAQRLNSTSSGDIPSDQYGLETVDEYNWDPAKVKSEPDDGI
jgi:hypothetical protein